MQILSGPLRRPTRNTLVGGGRSPPLLQRQPVNSHFMEQHGIMESMDFDDNGIPTVFFLNVDNLEETEEENAQEIIGLGEDEPFTHHYSVQADGSIHYQQNGGIDLGQYEVNVMGDERDAEHNFEFEEVSTMPLSTNNNELSDRMMSSGRRSPNASNTAATNGSQSFRSSIPTSELHDTSNNQRQENVSPNKRKVAFSTEQGETEEDFCAVEKKPKLVINLYEEDVGYEFGSLSPKDNQSVVQLSPLIPYSEDYILRAVDREEIPFQALGSLERDLKWTRGLLVAQIRDYRRFSKHRTPRLPPSNNNNNTNNNKGNGKASGAPVIREVILRPSTHSILHDFDRLIEQSIRWRRKWKSKRIKFLSNYGVHLRSGSDNSSSSEEEELDEGDGDSDYECREDLTDILAPLDGSLDNLTYDQRLELEKEFVNKTAGPLCLDPSPKVALIQNRIQFERLKWRCPSLTPKRLTKVTNPNESEETLGDEIPSNPMAASNAFLKFVQGVKDRVPSGIVVKDPDPLKLNGMAPFLEYPVLDPPTNMEDILKLAPMPEPSTIRPLTIDNYVKKIEEYTLETERRKRPHTTKLSIYQRNGMDNYFGELEMESIIEGAGITNKPGAGLPKDQMPANTTKCQFDLGSAQSVALYVKQFSDIFTEDGRRPCKIIYQKVGQTQPQVLYTNSYKTQQGPQTPTTPTSGTSATASSSSTTVTATVSSVVVSSSSGVTPVVTTTSTSNNTIATPPTQPPVQIVLPQPRSTPPDSALQQQQQQQLQQPVASVSPSVNFNLNVNSSQQMLTRPQIVSLNLQPHQQVQTGQKVSPATAVTASQQQLLQQRLLRLKQQQQQSQNQVPQTALAKLLLTNIQQNPSGSRPITVAVQPQPQKAQDIQKGPKLQSVVNPTTNTLRITTSQATTNQVQQQVGLVATSGQTAAQSVNLNVSGSQNVSVNLNTITLDGLLQGGVQNSMSQNTTHHHLQHQQTQLRSNPVNILRVNQNTNQVVNTGGPVALASTPQTVTSTTGSIQRQYATNLSSLLQSQPNINSQRILINSNNGQQITLANTSGDQSVVSGMDELSVPDLSSLLGHQTNMIQGHQSVDTHNLNLNLNVNLNSGSVMTDSVNHGGQGAQPPPFLVFISPLRSVPVSMNRTQLTNSNGTNLLQQHLNQGANSLSLNLQSIQQQPQTMDTIVTSLAGNNNVITVSSGTGQHAEIQDGGGDIFNPVNDNMVPDLSQVKMENLDMPTNTVMIGNTAYSVNVSNGGQEKKDSSVITLSDLLGSSSTPSSTTNSTLSSLILHNNSTGNSGQIVVSAAAQGSSVAGGSVVSSTPRLSALLAGTPSADSGVGLVNVSSAGSTGVRRLSTVGGSGLNTNNEASRTLLDRLTASISSSSGVAERRTGGSGLNPIASATPNVVLDHPVLAATLTGQQSPKVVSAYRQIAPAPTNAPGGRGKHQ